MYLWAGSGVSTAVWPLKHHSQAVRRHEELGTSKEKESETNRRRRIGVAIWILVESPLSLAELAAGKIVDMLDHLNSRQLLGRHPAWIPAAAHFTDEVWSELEQRHPVLYEAGH